MSERELFTIPCSEGSDRDLIEYSLAGNGRDLIVLVPGLARGLGDYDTVSEILVSAAYTVVEVALRGVGGSTGDLEEATLYDFADDIFTVIEHLDYERVHLVGNAFGTRIARCVATKYPELLTSLVILGAGGKAAPQKNAIQAFGGFLSALAGKQEATQEQLIQWARFALVGKNSDCREALLDGWYPQVIFLQYAAQERTPLDWWHGGTAPLLVVQGAQDILAPPENGYLLADEREQVTVVDIPEGGHLLLMDHATEVADHILTFIKKV